MKKDERCKSMIKAAKEATIFLEELSKAIDDVGQAKMGVRVDWMKWSVVDRDYFGEKSLAMQKYCMNQINNLKRDEAAASLEELVPLHRFFIMLASMQMFDERLHRWYLQITQGRLSIKQWLLPLAGNSAFEYWQSIDETTRHWSLQG